MRSVFKCISQTFVLSPVHKCCASCLRIFFLFGFGSVMLCPYIVLGPVLEGHVCGGECICVFHGTTNIRERSLHVHLEGLFNSPTPADDRRFCVPQAQISVILLLLWLFLLRFGKDDTEPNRNICGLGCDIPAFANARHFWRPGAGNSALLLLEVLWLFFF